MDRSTVAERLSRTPPAPITLFANVYRMRGWGGTAPPSALARLDVATAMPSASRLEFGAVALR
jgi:hypothetical protein